MLQALIYSVLLVSTVSPIVQANETPEEQLAPMPDQMENITDNEILAEAYGFLLAGDASWDSTHGYEISECVINYSTYYRGAIRLDVTHLLNEVVWDSQQVEFNDGGQTIVRFSCDETCLTQKAYTEDPSLSEMLPLFNDQQEREITLLLSVNIDRFNRALEDVVSQCPGAQSRY